LGAPLEANPASTLTVNTALDENDGSCSDGSGSKICEVGSWEAQASTVKNKTYLPLIVKH
jgi:hypothetical protein